MSVIWYVTINMSVIWYVTISVTVSNHEIVKYSQEYIYFDKEVLTLSLLK